MTDSFKFLLKKGANVCTTVHGSTVLIEAVNRNRLDFVDYLVTNASKLGLDIHVTDRRGAGVLHYAASVGSPDILARLMQAGCGAGPDAQGRTLLMQAALHGHAPMLRCLAAQADTLALKLEQADNDGRNALFYGVESGCLEVVQCLVSLGLQCRADRGGKTNLMQAARGGSAPLTAWLLARAPALSLDPAALDARGESALFYAVRSRCAAVVGTLMGGHGGELDPCANNTQGVSALGLSLAHGLNDVIEALLEGAPDLGAALAVRDPKGRTPLHHFAEKGDLARLRRYAGAGRYPGSGGAGGVGGPGGAEDGDLGGCTLLMSACTHAELEVVQYLVEELKVDVSAVDARGRSALFYAVEAGSVPLTTYLLDRTPPPLLPDNQGLTLLMVAVVACSRPLVGALLACPRHARALLDRVDRAGRSELHYCALHDCTDILGDILGATAGWGTAGGVAGAAGDAGYSLPVGGSTNGVVQRVDVKNEGGRTPLIHPGGVVQRVDARDEEGRTPLMCACEHGRLATMACLLRRGGARADLTDRGGRNALHYCLTSPSPSLHCARLLVERGADVNARDAGGVTPLMLACAACAHTPALIRLLVDQGADPTEQDGEGRDAFDHCPPLHADYVKGVLRERTEMPEAERAALLTLQPALTDLGLHLNSVLRGLMRAGVLTKTLSFEVMKRAPPERLDTLLTLLRTRGGERAFRAFCAVLRGEGELEHAYRLQQLAYRRSPEIYW